MKGSNKILISSLLLIGCFDLFIAYQVIGLKASHLHAENGFLENLQAVLLVLSIVVFLSQLFLTSKYNRIFPLGGAFLCFAFLLREIDIEDLDVPAIIIFLGSGTGRNVMVALLATVLIVYAVIHFHEIKNDIPAFFIEKSSLTILVGLILLVSGGVFDKKIHLAHYQFYEEIIEVTGYYLVFTGAVMAWPFLQSSREVSFRNRNK
ncbi:MAG: hypothetical protein U9R57_14330 [Thermodesulfobacteriota bacterium]|nr:hypothetical protein [Thermodesulfobacteriota bacterium]